jgi:nitroimidazol reductase NimA-like FMN-containing flavoprotein (pyridoxamine 5'-phosphate oxidase superfamily)
VADERHIEVLDEDACIELLLSHNVGRIAFIDAEGPMLLPVNFRFVRRNGPHWVIIRTQPNSEIARAQGGTVALEIDDIDVTAHRGWSVVARGAVQPLEEDDLTYLRSRFDPGPWLDDRDAWLLVRCSAITGRRVTGTTEWPFSEHAYL